MIVPFFMHMTLFCIISHYSRLFKFILLKYFVDASTTLTTLKIEVVPSAKNGNLGIHFIIFFEHGRRSNLTVAYFFLTLVTKIKVKIWSKILQQSENFQILPEVSLNFSFCVIFFMAFFQ